MKRTGKAFILFAALVALLCALPLKALAADAGNIGAPDLSLVTNETEKTYYKTPSGHAGQSLTTYIPVYNKSALSLSQVRCLIETGGNPDSFPFVDNGGSAYFEAVPYQKWNGTTLVAWDGAALAAGERAYFRLTATLQSSLAVGTKSLSFTIMYNDPASTGGAVLEDTIRLSLAVNAIPAPPLTPTPKPSSSSGGSGFRSKPKVIVESYRFSSDTLYAGDACSVTLVIRNTSEKEAVNNLQLNFTNESGAILPVAGGSNSVYIGEIKKGESCTHRLDLTLAPDAEAKAHMLSITLAYEGTRNRAEFTETTALSVPVLQRARVRINDPVVYDDPWIGSSVSVGVTLFNLGKSPLYNATVELLPNEALTLEETYFGGNIASGGTMRAELTVTPLISGQIGGVLMLTYEDVYGNPTEQELPLSLFVNEESPFMIVSTFGNAVPTEEAMGGATFAWYWWALGAAALIAGIVVLGVKMKKNRVRALEDF